MKTYDDWLPKSICNMPVVSCYQGDCRMNPEIENLSRNYEQMSEGNNIDNKTYRQWLTDQLWKQLCNLADYIKSFADKLNIIHHSSIAIMFLQITEALEQCSGHSSSICGLLLFTKWNNRAHQFCCYIRLFTAWHCTCTSVSKQIRQFSFWKNEIFE